VNENVSSPKSYVSPHTLRVFNRLPGSPVSIGAGFALLLLIPLGTMFGGALIERGLELFVF